MKFYISSADDSAINFLDFTDLKNTSHDWDLNYLYACIDYLQIVKTLRIETDYTSGPARVKVDMKNVNNIFQLNDAINSGKKFLNNYFQRYRNPSYYLNRTSMTVLGNDIIEAKNKNVKSNNIKIKSKKTKLMISQNLGALSNTISPEYKRFITYSFGEALPFYIMQKLKSKNINFTVVKLQPSQNSLTPDFLLYDASRKPIAIWECKGTVDATNERTVAQAKKKSEQLKNFVKNLHNKSVIRQAQSIYSQTRLPLNLKRQSNKELEMSIADPETLITYQPVNIILDKLFFIVVCMKSDIRISEEKDYRIEEIISLMERLLVLEEPKEMMLLKEELKSKFKDSTESVEILKSNDDYNELIKIQKNYYAEIDKIIHEDTFEKIERMSNSYTQQLISKIVEGFYN